MNERETKIREALTKLARKNPNATGAEVFKVAREAGAGSQWARLLAKDVFDEIVSTLEVV